MENACKMVNSYSSPTLKLYIWDNSGVFCDQIWDNALFMELLYNFDCFFSKRIHADDHDLPRFCKGFIKCKFVDEEGNNTQQIDIIVEPMKYF